MVQIAAGRQGVFRSILLDAVLALIGAVLELTYFSYRERGTIYVETEKREKRIALAEYNVKNQSYYVDESLDDYSVKASGKGYSKSYKKREVGIEEDAGIDRPF